MRPLLLHVSALSDAEYAFYTTALTDLATCGDGRGSNVDYGSLVVGIREARAWLHGRFSGLLVTDIDSVLTLFHPNPSQGDVLTGGQFFAVLRLVVHLDNGRPLDDSLAFIQASPSNNRVDWPAFPQRRQFPPQSRPSSNALSPQELKRHTNPFAHPENSGVLFPAGTPSSPKKIESQNPFIPHANSPNMQPAFKVDHAHEKAIPPLPPRKPQVLPPPRHKPLLPSSQHNPPDAIAPVKLSSLMQQSLQASKAGQSMKKAEETLEKETVLQVLKSSLPAGKMGTVTPPSSSSDSERRPTRISNSSSPLPPLPRRKNAAPSESDSLQSYEQVAAARISSMHPSAVDTRSNRMSSLSISTRAVSEGPTSPPKHPDRRLSRTEPYNDSNNSVSTYRVFRSNSLHSPSSTPSTRHRRPESLQYPFASTHDQSSPMSVSQLQKTFENVQTRVQPTFDKVRFKAEAGLSRRGFLRAGEDGQQGLMDDHRDNQSGYSSLNSEEDDESPTEGQLVEKSTRREEYQKSLA